MSYLSPWEIKSRPEPSLHGPRCTLLLSGMSPFRLFVFVHPVLLVSVLCTDFTTWPPTSSDSRQSVLDPSGIVRGCVQPSLPTVGALRDSLRENSETEATFMGCYQWLFEEETSQGKTSTKVELENTCKNASGKLVGEMNGTDQISQVTTHEALSLPSKMAALVLSSQKLVDIGKGLLSSAVERRENQSIPHDQVLNDLFLDWDQSKCGVWQSLSENNSSSLLTHNKSILLELGKKALYIGEALLDIFDVSWREEQREKKGLAATNSLNESDLANVDRLEESFVELESVTKQVKKILHLLTASFDVEIVVRRLPGLYSKTVNTFEKPNNQSFFDAEVAEMELFVKHLICYAAFPPRLHSSNALRLCPDSLCYRVAPLLRALNRLTQKHFSNGLVLLLEAWIMLCDTAMPEALPSISSEFVEEQCVSPVFRNFSGKPTVFWEIKGKQAIRPESPGFKYRGVYYMCRGWHCPEPLIFTANAKHAWPPIQGILTKAKTLLRATFPELQLINQSVFPCGLGCFTPGLSSEQTDLYYTITRAIGWPSFAITLIAVIVFLANHRSIIALPSRICAYANMSFLFAITMLLTGTFTGFARSIACHEDGTLNLKETDLTSSCSVFAAVGTFSMILLTFLLLCLCHAWYRLVVLLESGLRQASNEHLKDRRLEIFYVTSSISVSALLTFFSALEEDNSGQLVGRPCNLNPKMIFYYYCIPNLITLCLQVPLVVVGMFKLVSLSKTTKRQRSRFYGSRRSRRLSSSGSVSRRKSSRRSSVRRSSARRSTIRRSKVGLERTIKLLCAPLIVSIFHLIIVIETAARIVPEKEEIIRQLVAYTQCTFLQLQPDTHCPSLPRMPEDLYLLQSIFVWAGSIVSCSWMLDWKYWDHLWIVRKFRKQGVGRRSTRSRTQSSERSRWSYPLVRTSTSSSK